jgi:hypothetical protein
MEPPTFKRPDREADIEVELSLLDTAAGGRKFPLWQGCRLPHDFGLPDEWNDGMYEFVGDPPTPGAKGTAKVWLLAPDRNRGRFDVGFKFRVWDGRRWIGDGRITAVLNPELRSNCGA